MTSIRLAFPSDAGKADVVDEPVSFVTYEHTDEGWRSAVAEVAWRR